MKIDKSAVAEVAIGFFIAGILLIAIQGLVGGYIASHGAGLHGKDSTGKDFEPSK